MGHVKQEPGPTTFEYLPGEHAAQTPPADSSKPTSHAHDVDDAVTMEFLPTGQDVQTAP